MKLFYTNWLLTLVTMTIGVGAMASPTLPEGNMPSAENLKGHMFFEKNYGQLTASNGEAADNVLYYATTPQFSWYLTTEGIQYAFVDKSTENRGYYRLDLNYVGANFSQVKQGEEAAKVNYYRGNTGLPTKSLVKELTVQNFYPNIDLQILATATGFKYNYLVRPGGDPNKIQMTYSAHDYAKVLKSGEFVVATQYGEVVESKPFSYQLQEGEKMETPTEFLYENGLLSFELGSYDASKTLIIDPIIEIQTYLGGASDDEIFAIDNNDDDQGSLDSVKIYVTGYTTYNNYPSGTGYTYTGGNGNRDAFVACLDQDLSSLNWITFFAGSEDEVGRGVMYLRDSTFKRYLFIAGETNSNDFPVLNGIQMSNAGAIDAFVCKLNARNGRSRQWRTYMGGTEDDYATDIYCFDTRVNIGGYTTSPMFNAGIGGSVPSVMNNGGVDAFFSRLVEDNGSLDAGTFIGTANDELAHAVGIKGGGGVMYLVGTGHNGGDNDAKVWTASLTAGSISGLTTSTFGTSGDGNQIAYDGDTRQSGVQGDGLVIVGSTDADPSFSQERNAYNPGTGGATLDGFVLTIDGSLAEENSLFSAGDKNDYFTAVVMRDGLLGNTNWNTPFVWTAVGVTNDNLDAFYDSDVGYNVYMSEYTCGSSDVGFALSGDGAIDNYWGGYLDCNTLPNDITIGYDAAGDIDCGMVHVGGSTTNSGLSLTSGAHDGSIGGSLDGFVSKFDMRMEPKLFYDNNVFCRGAGVTQANSTVPISSTYKYTKVWGYPKGGYVYGDGTYYDENNGYYVFHADSGTQATTKTLTYRLGLWGCGASEIDDDMKVVYARFIPWYMVICDAASGNNPGVDSAKFNSKGYVPGGSGITAAYSWYKNSNTLPVLETTNKWLFYKPAVSDYVQGKINFTGGSITGGCGIPSSNFLVDSDTSRIELSMRHAYDYYLTGSAVNIDINRGSWWRYFDWAGGAYTGYSWKKGVYPSGNSVGTNGASLDMNTYGQGSYYIEARSKCETAAGPPATVTHRDKYATLSANNHCRTPQHESVNDNNSANGTHIRVKEPDALDYFSGTASHYLLKGRIDILPGVYLSLSNAELTMHPGTEINIFPGGQVDLTNCQITTCDVNNPWDFIRVIGADDLSLHSNGEFFFSGSTGLPLIEHGRVGLYSHKDGEVYVNNTIFEHNKVHAYIYGNEDENNITIENSVFGDPQDYAVSYSTINSIYSVYNGEETYILGENSDHMEITGNMFFGTTSDVDYSGITLQSGADNLVQSNEFEDGYLDYAIHCTNADNYTIANNNVCNTKTTQGGCHIGTGLYMDYVGAGLSATSIVVENNLKYMPVGMAYLHNDPPSGSNSKCSLNVFRGNDIGLYIATHDVNYRLYGCKLACGTANSAVTSNSINLEVSCNEFFNNDVGVLGYGKLIAQGSGVTSHGNDWGGTASSNNYHYDVLWGGVVTQWYSTASDQPNTAITASSPDYCISCTNYGHSDMLTNVTLPSASTQACIPIPPFVSLDEDAEGVSVNLYPNPFSSEVFVDINAPEFGGDMSVTLYDLQGRIIYAQSNVASGLMAIPTGSVGKGAYIMKVSLENEAPQLFRIIKN